jgi:hypothetical protein
MGNKPAYPNHIGTPRTLEIAERSAILEALKHGMLYYSHTFVAAPVEDNDTYAELLGRAGPIGQDKGRAVVGRKS